MVKRIDVPAIVQSAGKLPKRIEEFVGHVSTGAGGISIARMVSPSGWVEPGQTPEFDEYTVVLRGSLRVTTKSGVIEVSGGQAVIAPALEWVQYSTPAGAEYIAVCVPSFSPCSVHRDRD
ncbi:hypothetical protein BH18PSE1_BH18PSE1_04350 [soil metagenome]